MTETATPRADKKPVWQRLINVTFKRLARSVDHDEVVEHVAEEGHLSGRYIFMVVMSCGIAILGLLLSSPAVVIGAMLISPLMGPIMLMGFSLSTLDLHALKEAAVSMVIGVVAAIAISFLITILSPITEATPEILARTRPNFFDLLVAVFSGLAGGYAVITRKGETIVGVAIATALMPPLAVTGYGLAVGSMAVAGGSFFLFMTNLLAIALSVTVLSRIYGFGSEHSPRHTLGQTAFIVVVFAALSLPLGLALRNIAYETTVTNTIKADLLTPFANVQNRLGDVIVRFPKDESIDVEATVLTYERIAGAEDGLAASLSEKLGRVVRIDLDQVLINRDIAIEQAAFLELANSSLGAPLRAEISKLETLSQVRRMEAELRNAVPFKLAGADIDAEGRSAIFFAAREAAFSLEAYRAIEAGLSANFTNWQIRVVPPIMDLPLIVYEKGEDAFTPEMQPVLDLSIWALEHWGVSEVEVVGYASSSGALQNFDNQALAYRRAQAVADALTARGFAAEPVGEYRAFRQTADERRLGYQRFQTVLIRPRTATNDVP
jgi:uncharacterized hydrophobic protein (TIGR00271 family)